MNPLHLIWRALRGLLLFLTVAIFMGGLLYNYAISRSNSQNLNRLRQIAYPFLEKSDLVKIKLILMQEEFYKAVSQRDEKRLFRVEEEGEALLVLLLQIEPLVANPEAIATVRSILFQYLQQGKEISRKLIREGQGPDLLQFQLIELNQQGKLLAESIEHLVDKSRLLFNVAMERSEEDSRKMLQVGLWSSIAGIFLIGGISSWIVTLNRRLSHINQHLEEDVKLRTQELESFVYTVSHDLKSPVVSMQGMASLFVETYGAQLEEKGRHYIERIIANTNYMEELILGLLTLSRVGRRPAGLKEAEIRIILQEIIESNKEQFAEKKVEVIVEPSLPPFIFDHLQLTQVFQNLISNAVKYMGSQVHPRIEIGGSAFKEKVEFYVRDNGIGIDPAYHEKIFGIFQRLKDVEADGTGVGLSIVKKIVDLAGGKIWIESKKGEGATFFFQLPCKRSELRRPNTSRE